LNVEHSTPSMNRAIVEANFSRPKLRPKPQSFLRPNRNRNLILALLDTTETCVFFLSSFIYLFIYFFFVTLFVRVSLTAAQDWATTLHFPRHHHFAWVKFQAIPSEILYTSLSSVFTVVSQGLSLLFSQVNLLWSLFWGISEAMTKPAEASKLRAFDFEK